MQALSSLGVAFFSFLSGGFVLGGVLSGGKCPRGFSPGVLSEGLMSRGLLFGFFTSRGKCPGTVCRVIELRSLRR